MFVYLAHNKRSEPWSYCVEYWDNLTMPGETIQYLQHSGPGIDSKSLFFFFFAVASNSQESNVERALKIFYLQVPQSALLLNISSTNVTEHTTVLHFINKHRRTHHPFNPYENLSDNCFPLVLVFVLYDLTL